MFGAEHIHRIIVCKLSPSAIDLCGLAERVAIEKAEDFLGYLDGEEGYEVDLELLRKLARDS